MLKSFCILAILTSSMLTCVGSSTQYPAEVPINRPLVSRYKGLEFRTVCFEDDCKSCLLIYRLAYWQVSHVYESFIGIHGITKRGNASVEAWLCRSVPADALSDSYYFGWMHGTDLYYVDHDSALVAPEVSLLIEGEKIVGINWVDAFLPVDVGGYAPPVTRTHYEPYPQCEQITVVPCTAAKEGYVSGPSPGIYLRIKADYELNEYPFLLLEVDDPLVYFIGEDREDVHGNLDVKDLPFKFYYVVNLRAVSARPRPK